VLELVKDDGKKSIKRPQQSYLQIPNAVQCSETGPVGL
jgi:hypothetical protein